MKKVFVLALMTLSMTMYSLSSKAVEENLRIMSFNIPYRNVVTETNTWDMIATSLHSYFATTNADLIGLQEPVRDELVSLLSGMPGYAMIGVGRNDGKEGNEYSCILYKTNRFRVLDNGTYWLTDTPDVVSRVDGAGHNRIATWGYFEDKLTGAQFLYTNTHLSYESPQVKHPQIRVLKEQMYLLNQKYGENLPHFLTGDFNMPPTETENYNYVLNYKLNMKDCWTSTRNIVNKTNGDGFGRIDYVYFSYKNCPVTCTYAEWGSRFTEDGVTMSDHHPLFADLHWTISTEDEIRGAIASAWTAIDSTMTYSNRRSNLANAANTTSDGTNSSNPVAYMYDNNTETFCHSLENLPPNQPHYIQVSPTRNITALYFQYVRRNSDTWGIKDRWQDVMVTASEDGEKWDYITELYDFGGNELKTYTSETIPLRKVYRHIRFNIMRTPGMRIRNGNPLFTASEFKMCESVVASSCEYKSVETIGAAVDSLIALIETAKTALEEKTATSQHLTDLQQGIEALRTARHNHATGITSIAPSENGETTVYSLNGSKLADKVKGVNVVVSEDGSVRKELHM